MEYFIMKRYQEEKRNYREKGKGFDRYERETKCVVIICFLITFLSSIELLISVLFFSDQFWHFISLLGFLAAVLIFCCIDNLNQKKHMDRYVDSYKKKLFILDGVLFNMLGNNEKQTIEELISIYQGYVDREMANRNRRNRVIVAIFSVVGSVLAFSMDNINIIGIDLSGWVDYAIFLIFFAALAGIVIYLYNFLDTSIKKYEMIINDLKELKLFKR